MSLVQMSIYGGVMILFITLLRALFLERLPKRTFLALWGVATVRLLVPFKLPSVFSLYTLLARVGVLSNTAGAVGTGAVTAAQDTAVLTQSTVPVVHTVGQGVSAATETVVSTATAAAVKSALPAWQLLWAGVALCCAAGFAVAYRRSLREFRTSLPVQNGAAARWLQAHPLKRPLSIRQSDRIDAPLTYGVFRPVILMPKHTDWDDTETLQYVLAHEYTHVRRFDNLAKLILAATLCLHWFNPLVWVMYVLANRDIELACDESVVRTFGMGKKAAYAYALIRMEETRGCFAPLYSSFSKNAIEERIVSIMKTRKSSVLAAVAACVLVAAVGTACGTTAAPASSAASSTASASAATASSLASTDPELYEYLSSGSIRRIVNPNNGAVSYQYKDGSTTKTVTEAEFNAMYPDLDIEWWTADEYRAWYNEQMDYLLANKDQTITTEARGEFVCTMDAIKQLRSGYESTLAQIEDGMLLAKTKYGGAMAATDYYALPDTSSSIKITCYGQTSTYKGPCYYFSTTLTSTGETYTFGPFKTEKEYLAAVKPFFGTQLQLGNVTWNDAQYYLLNSSLPSSNFSSGTGLVSGYAEISSHHADDHHSSSHS